jgi:hypothetical protein
MEPYVAEQVGADILAHDPEVAAAFKKRLASDPAFAASPGARLEFFYRRHPSWDERLNLYPVYRIAAVPKGPTRNSEVQKASASRRLGTT